MWSFNVLGFHLIYWWVVLNNWRGWSEWSFARFSALFLYGVALYFCAAVILPQESGRGVDLKARFTDVRGPFFLAWLAVMLLESLDSLLKGTGYVLTQLGAPYLLLMGSSLAFTLIALRTSNRRFHWFFAVETTAAFGTWVTVRFFQI